MLLAGLALIVPGCEGSAEERRAGIYDLQADPTPENVQSLRGMLDDPDRDVRATALNVLVGLRPPDAVDLARAGLDDDEGFVRSIAAKRLADLGATVHVPDLGRLLLQDPDARVRQVAAQSLGRLDGAEAIDALVAGLDDPMPTVRLEATRALRDLDPTRASERLARMVLEDENWEVRVQAAGALGESGDARWEPVLRAALEDENEFVRSAAAAGLQRLQRLGP